MAVNMEAPRLVAVLKEMKDGLDNVTNKIKFLTAKVKADSLPTSDGMSYLEAKHLLLLNYCQSLVYYLLSKARGLSIQGHPVVRSLVEIRLFLEKIRPIDKKLQYQIQKLTSTTETSAEKSSLTENQAGETKKAEDLLKFRPNPDMLVSKESTERQRADGIYLPPKIAPAAMEGDKMSKREKNALRKEMQSIRQAQQSVFVQDLMNDLEGKPDEIKETIGVESMEMTKYASQMEERARQEEEMFSRAPLSKSEKQKMKHLKKSRNGLQSLTEGFFDEIKSLPIEDSTAEQSTSFNDARSGNRKFSKRKRKH